jgi:tetratricopeptide (TPR) repeat protein
MEKGNRVHRDLVWGLAIFFIALALRFLFQLEIKDHPLSRQLFLDPAFYDDWAQAIAGGDWLGQGVFYANPLYAYFLALIYGVMGHSIFGTKLVQSVLGALACLMVYLIGRRVFGRRAGILAGLMAGLYAPFIFYEGTITISTLGVFLSLLMVLILLTGERPSPGRSFWAGVIWGLRALARFDLTFLAALIWFLAGGDGGVLRRRFLMVLFFCLGSAAIILPVTARNLLVGGKPVIITAHGGETFYGGNNPRATGTYAPPPGVRPGTAYEHEDFRRLASEMVGHRLSLDESSSFWLRRAVAFIRANPGQYVRLQLRKLLLFWSPHEIPDNRNYHFFRRFSLILRLPLLSFTILGPLALLGMALGLRTWRRSLLLYLQVLSSMVSVLLFFVLARYRLPTVPFLILFAAYALDWSLIRCRQRRWGLLALSWLPALFLVVFFTWQMRTVAQRGFENRYETLGVALIREGRVDEGIVELQGVVRLDPGRVTAHYNLGVVYLEEKREHILAVGEFKAVLELQEDYPGAHRMLGKAYRELNQLEGAEGELRKELNFWPEDIQTRLELGLVLIELERWPQAEEQLWQVTRQRAQDAVAHHLLGNVLYMQGKTEEAVLAWERALQLNPTDEELRKNLESLKKKSAVRQ